MFDGTISYDIVIEASGKDPQLSNAASATTTIYLKGNQTRTDMVNSLGNESTIHDAKTGSAVILKEYSGQKLMITLTKENWAEKNKAYNDIVFENTAETKVVAGYACKKAVANLNGKPFSVYYAVDLAVANNAYNALFKNLPGIAMEYELESGKNKFKYQVSKISFDAVQGSKFDAPKSGYRVMTYEENKQIKKGE